MRTRSNAKRSKLAALASQRAEQLEAATLAAEDTLGQARATIAAVAAGRGGADASTRLQAAVQILSPAFLEGLSIQAISLELSRREAELEDNDAAAGVRVETEARATILAVASGRAGSDATARLQAARLMLSPVFRGSPSIGEIAMELQRRQDLEDGRTVVVTPYRGELATLELPPP